jgi:uncharacterized protein
MYPRYMLTLMITHACNMRCSYCYAGEKSNRSMPEATGRRAIDRALASLEPGGDLTLGFFGGEPLLEPALATRLADYACDRAAEEGALVTFCLTTNGTVSNPLAWHLMMREDLALAVSFDGLPELHDRHRRLVGGGATSAHVLTTMRWLLDAGKEFRVAVVVRPDTVAWLAESIEFLRDFGVREIDLGLDLWATWSREDARALDRAVAAAAQAWREGLPHVAVNWFDDKAAHLCRLDVGDELRCGFGRGEIAVAPSGGLYPCERLIGEDAESNPMRLPGHATDGCDFLDVATAPARCASECDACSVESYCNTFCRCSNYVRTGDVRTPDRLLCLWNQACLRETALVLRGLRRPAVAMA